MLPKNIVLLCNRKYKMSNTYILGVNYISNGGSAELTSWIRRCVLLTPWIQHSYLKRWVLLKGFFWTFVALLFIIFTTNYFIFSIYIRYKSLWQLFFIFKVEICILSIGPSHGYPLATDPIPSFQYSIVNTKVCVCSYSLWIRKYDDDRTS